MIKKQIKKQIMATGTYRVVEGDNKLIKKENKLLKDKLNNSNKSINQLKNRNLQLQKSINNHRLLINTLKAETNSLKQFYLTDTSLAENYDNLTIVMPYRKTDDHEREENLDITLRYLNRIGIKNLIISEYSKISSENLLMQKYGNLFNSFTIIFTNSHDNLFNRALAINRGVTESKTLYFAALDVDCLTKKRNIDLAINLLDNGFDVVHPFNRIIKDVIDKEKFIEEYDFETVTSETQYREYADGGIVFWRKDRFIDIGMANEYFCGWGGEDNELSIRTNLFELKQIRIDDVLYHLYHNRPQKRTKNNIEQIEQISKIKTKEDLLKEIDKWPWVNTQKNEKIIQN
jgi:hypothetical protein